VLNRQKLGEQLGFGVRRLGNPVAWRDADGRIHLFVVATGLGGWAAGRIVHLQSQKSPVFEDLKFETPRLLPLSWLWNTSHLVRGGAMGLQDGGMVLPVYFELGKKYPLALRFDAHGDFLGMVRMSARGDVLQPGLLMRSDVHWLALLRDNSPGRKLKAVETRDGGQSWIDLSDLPLNNPDASVATLALNPGQLYMAHNSQPHDRTVLDLSQSEDGLSWQKVSTLAAGSGKDEFSYPSLAWADNNLWVSYTEQRRTIAWKRFAIKEGQP
jgi:predicted neuraminidase